MTQRELHQRILEAERAGEEAAARGEDPGVTNVGTAFGGFWNADETIGDFGSRLSDLWDRFRNGETNTTGKEIADENLAYERERSEVEDARYEDETTYNRAWAEDERAYNRALQERLFAREDTAASRQAADLARVGINPLSYQLNGANAGQAVTSATAPVESSRSANPLHNDFKMQEFSPLQALSAISGIASQINGISTGQYTRDSLALENDKKYLENLVYARKNGIDYVGPEIMASTTYRKNHWVNASTGSEFYNDDEWRAARGSELSQDQDIKRNNQSKINHNIFDWESDKTKFIKSLGTLDFKNFAENFLTNVANAGNWVNSNFKDFNKDMDNSAIMNFIRKFFAL